MQKITTEKWISKAKKIHGNKYNYNKVDYSLANNKVCIYCNKCKRFFWQRAAAHLSGAGCIYCGYENMRKKQSFSIENFIEKANQIHKNKYSYSNSKYINSSTKIEIKCNTCGLIFYQTPSHHLAGEGCPNCSKIKQHNNLKISNDDFIARAKKIHKNKYDYVNVTYQGMHKKVKIHCNICGYDFFQTPANHLNNRGCPNCKKITNTIKKLKKAENVFYNLIKHIHKNRYDYSNSKYKGMRKKIEIKCNKCGKIFNQTAMSHLNGSGCPYCKQSKGEIQIQNWLDEHSIEYIPQFRFEDCRDKNPLPFDFYLPKHHVCIEFQGKQHYDLKFFINKYKKQISIAKHKYNKLKTHDKIKKVYCKSNKIKLLEIKYNQNINKLLEILLHN